MKRKYKMTAYLEEIYCEIKGIDIDNIADHRDDSDYQKVAMNQRYNDARGGGLLNEAEVRSVLNTGKLTPKREEILATHASKDDREFDEPAPAPETEQADEDPESADEPVKRGPGRPKKADS